MISPSLSFFLHAQNLFCACKTDQIVAQNTGRASGDTPPEGAASPMAPRRAPSASGSIGPRSVRPRMARNEIQSGRIGTVQNEVRFGPESLFGWPSLESNLGRIGLHSHLHGPEQSQTSSLLERNQARRGFDARPGGGGGTRPQRHRRIRSPPPSRRLRIALLFLAPFSPLRYGSC